MINVNNNQNKNDMNPYSINISSIHEKPSDEIMELDLEQKKIKSGKTINIKLNKK